MTSDSDGDNGNDASDGGAGDGGCGDSCHGSSGVNTKMVIAVMGMAIGAGDDGNSDCGVSCDSCSYKWW